MRTSRRPLGKPLTNEPDPWEVWIDIDDHLQFVTEVIEHADLPTQVRTDLRECTNQISNRRTDLNLYMAVVGEFSSGKSTFIVTLFGFLRQLICHRLVCGGFLQKVSTELDMYEFHFATRSTFQLNAAGLYKNAPHTPGSFFQAISQVGFI